MTEIPGLDAATVAHLLDAFRAGSQLGVGIGVDVLGRATGVTRVDPETLEKVIKAISETSFQQGYELGYQQGTSGRPGPKTPALPLEALVTSVADAYLSGLRSAFGLIKVKR